MKKIKVIPITILSSVFVGCTAFGIAGCKENEKPPKTEPEYTYVNPDMEFKGYDNVFTLDGVTDEKIYNQLSWWAEDYPEDDGVTVRFTNYLGEKGVFFIFDVDDYAVNVNPYRYSFDNSGVTLYVAPEDMKMRAEGAWEIDFMANGLVNAKQFNAGYSYATVQPVGYENAPVVRAVPKGGAVNTDECKGYVIESYFTYEYLFGSDSKPENLKANFSIQRNSNAEKEHPRDTYYNFGDKIIAGFDWERIAPWWTFGQYGLDAVHINLTTVGSGSVKLTDKYTVKYGSTAVEIRPDEGFRIKNVMLEDNDVTDNLTFDNGVSYLALKHLAEDCNVSVEFEAVPAEKITLGGKLTVKGVAPNAEELNDLSVRFLSGGVEYGTALGEGGGYSLSVPSGKGTINVYSAKGYIAKSYNLTVGTQSVTENINLTEKDYGNNRTITLRDESVVAEKAVLFDGADIKDTLNSRASFSFKLKYDGQTLDENGHMIDPTFGKYDNNYTSANIRITTVLEDGSEAPVNIQVLCWEGEWIFKHWSGGNDYASWLDAQFLRTLGGDGVEIQVFIDDSSISFYCKDVLGHVYKLIFVDKAQTAAQTISRIEFFCENPVDHNIWAIENAQINLGKTKDSVNCYFKGFNGEQVTESVIHGIGDAQNDFFLAYKLNSSAVRINGTVSAASNKNVMLRCFGDNNSWSQVDIRLMLDNKGSCIWVSGNGDWTGRRILLSAEQLKLLGSSGLNIFVGHTEANKNSFDVYVDGADGTLVKIMTISSDNQSVYRIDGWQIADENSSGEILNVEFYGKNYEGELLTAINSESENTYSSVIDAEKTFKVLKNGVISKGDENTEIWMKVTDGNFFVEYVLKSDAVAADGSVTKSAKVVLRNDYQSNDDWKGHINLILEIVEDESGSYLQYTQEYSPWQSNKVFLTKELLASLASEEGLRFVVVHSIDKAGALTGYIVGESNLIKLFEDENGDGSIDNILVRDMAFTGDGSITVKYSINAADSGFDGGLEFTEYLLGKQAATLNLTHTPAKDAEHGQAGNIEYWSDGTKYYSDPLGFNEIELSETVIQALEHEWEWRTSDTEHWQYCKADGTEKEGSRGSHTEGLICSVCGKKQDLTYHDEVPAKHGIAGTKEYWTDREGNKYSDASGTTQITEPETIPALSHEWEWNHSDTEHWKECGKTHSDIVIDEATRAAHNCNSTVDGKCECGYVEPYSTIKGGDCVFGDNGQCDVWTVMQGKNYYFGTTVKSTAVQPDGTVNKAVTLTLRNDYQAGSEYKGHITVTLKLNPGDGNSYVEVENGYGNWSKYVYCLSKQQIVKLAGEGLQFVLSQDGDKATDIDLYLIDSELIKIYTFINAEADNVALNFISANDKENVSASYEVVIARSNEITSGLQLLKTSKSINDVSQAVVLSGITATVFAQNEIVNEGGEPAVAFTLNESGKTNVIKYTVQSQGFLNENGKPKGEAALTAKIQQMNGWWDKNGFILEFGEQSFVTSTKHGAEKLQLTPKQLQLVNTTGLNVYIVYRRDTSAESKFGRIYSVFIEDGSGNVISVDNEWSPECEGAESGIRGTFYSYTQSPYAVEVTQSYYSASEKTDVKQIIKEGWKIDYPESEANRLTYVAPLSPQHGVEGHIAYWTDGIKFYSDSVDFSEIQLSETVIQALEHEWTWKTSDTEHWQYCEADGAEKEGSRGSHTEGLICPVCGKKQDLTYHDEVPAKHGIAGTKEYWTDREGNKYSDASGATQITEPETIPALPHEWEWNYSETEHWKECTETHDQAVIDEATRAAHNCNSTVDGKCECGYVEPYSTIKGGDCVFGDNGQCDVWTVMQGKNYYFGTTVKSTAVQPDGTVNKAVTLTLRSDYQAGSEYKGHITVTLKLNPGDGNSFIEMENGFDPWTRFGYYLSKQQVAKLAGDGLQIVLSQDGNKATDIDVYLVDTKLIKLYTFQKFEADNVALNFISVSDKESVSASYEVVIARSNEITSGLQLLKTSKNINDVSQAVVLSGNTDTTFAANLEVAEGGDPSHWFDLDEAGKYNVVRYNVKFKDFLDENGKPKGEATLTAKIQQANGWWGKYGFVVNFTADGGSIKVVEGFTTDTYQEVTFTDKQLQLLNASGLNVYIVYRRNTSVEGNYGREYALYVDNGEGKLVALQTNFTPYVEGGESGIRGEFYSYTQSAYAAEVTQSYYSASDKTDVTEIINDGWQISYTIAE